MSTCVIAICDICGFEQEMKCGPQVADWEQELRYRGLVVSGGLPRDLPEPPRPVAS